MFNFRYSTASTPRVAAAALRGDPARHGLDYDLDWTGIGQAVPHAARHAWSTPPTQPIRDVTGVTPELSCTGGTSDGRFIADICPRGRRARPGQRDDPQDRRARARSPTSSRWRAIYRGILERLLLRSAHDERRPLHELDTLRDWLRYAVTPLRRGEASRSATARPTPTTRPPTCCCTRCTCRSTGWSRSSTRGSRRRSAQQLAQLLDAPHRRARSRRLPDARGVARRLPLLRRRARADSALVHRRAACPTASRRTSATPRGVTHGARPVHGLGLPRDPARARLSRRPTSTRSTSRRTRSPSRSATWPTTGSPTAST